MLVRQCGQLVERAAVLAQVGDDDVEAVVDDRLAVALGVPGRECLAEGLSFRLDAEVDMCRRAAEGCGDVPVVEVVDGRLASPRHLEMRVRVDRSRQDVLARSVDHLVRRDVERLADEGDALVLDEDVGDVVVGRRDHATALDQHGHLQAPFSSNPGPGPARAGRTRLPSL